MRKSCLIMILILLGLGIWFGIRFFLGGPEDSWICEKTPASASGSGEAKWVQHGHPQAPMPTTECK